MRLHIQRVVRAGVSVEGETIAAIHAGMLALVGFGAGDTKVIVERMLEKLLACRLFADEQGKTNLNLAQSGGALLLVPQFTLYADTGRGLRPGYSNAAEPKLARELFAYTIDLANHLCAARGIVVQSGEFGAHMLVELVNDGPYTLLLDSDD